MDLARRIAECHNWMTVGGSAREEREAHEDYFGVGDGELEVAGVGGGGVAGGRESGAR